MRTLILPRASKAKESKVVAEAAVQHEVEQEGELEEAKQEGEAKLMGKVLRGGGSRAHGTECALCRGK